MGERSSKLDNTETLETGVFETDSTEETSLAKREDDGSLAKPDMPDDEAGEEATAEADQIREQIVETRRGMSETIDAIQEKLSFSNISEQVQTQVSEQINNAVETAKDAFLGKTADVVNTVGRSFRQLGRSDLAKKAQENPTALAIIGAGIGALLIGFLTSGSGKKSKKKYAAYRYESDSYSYDDDDQSEGDDAVRYANTSRRELTASEVSARRSSASHSQTSGSRSADSSGSVQKTVSDAASSTYAGVTGALGSAYESIGSVAGKTYEGASSVAGKTYEGVGDIAGKTYEAVGSAAGYTYEKAGDLGGQVKINYDHYIEENPLAVGAVALALGAAVGFAIPLTRRENEYLGEYRDQVLEKAQATAQDAIGSVKQMATDAQKIITEEVKSKTA